MNAVPVPPFTSVEVRWFGQGEVPALLAAWFGRGPGDVEAQPPRVDHYLRRADEGLGVKWRDGLVEVKQRQGSYGVLELDERAVGHVERWRKWSFPLQVSAAAPTAWLAVRKERLLRRYIIAERQHLVSLPPAEPAATGCDWELTRLQIGDQEDVWWTIAFEAFGEPTGLRRQLLQVAGLILARDRAPHLPAEASAAYPAWLLTQTAAQSAG